MALSGREMMKPASDGGPPCPNSTRLGHVGVDAGPEFRPSGLWVCGGSLIEQEVQSEDFFASSATFPPRSLPHVLRIHLHAVDRKTIKIRPQVVQPDTKIKGLEWRLL